MTSFVIGVGLFSICNCAGLFVDLSSSVRYLILVSAICFAVVALKKDCKNKVNCSFCLFLCFLGMWNGNRVFQSAENQLSPCWEKNVIVSGTVEPLSWRERDGIQNFIINVHKMEVNGQQFDYKKKIRVSIKTIDKLLDKDVLVSGKIQELVGFRNPGSFDSKIYYRVQGIGGKLTKAKLIKCKKNDSFSTKLALVNINIRKTLDTHLSERVSQILGGMLLGGNGLDDESKEIFADNGLNHLLSVSGTHLVLLTSVLSVILKPLPSILRNILILACLGTYGLFCGLKPPVLRALIMSGVVIFGGNGVQKGRLLGLASMFLLLFKPDWILDIGFQLSFGASAGLIYILPKLKKYLEIFLPEIIAEAMGVTLAVQLMTLPIIINKFHQISLISLISNVVLVPIVELALLLTILGLVVFYIFDIQGILRLSSFLIEQVVVQAELLRKIPYSTIAIASLPSWSYGLYYGWLTVWLDKGLVQVLENRERKLYLYTLPLVLAITFLWANILPKPFAVYFLDVGQGDCAVVVTPWRKTIVVDTGGLKNYDTGANILVPFLRSLGTKSVDFLVISHYDNDHVGGLTGLLRNIKVNSIILPNEILTEASKPIFELCKKNAAKKYTAEKGLVFTIDKVKLEILGVGTSKVNGNEASTVLRVSHGGKSFLFTGDMDAKRENEADFDPRADVLKVAHHGSRSSSTEEFLARVNPKIAVISVGINNNYGHPHKDVLERLIKAGIKVLRTDKRGCVKLELADI